MTPRSPAVPSARLRIGSLFSGIGGLELGLEWAGVGHTVWQVEQNAYCRAVLAKHWPDAERFTDVREVGAHNLSAVDVICGGYPCQPFSIAGDRGGTSDPRHLWPEFARIVRALRPYGIVLENVPAHLSLGFGGVLGDLARMGYDAEWGVLRAEHAGVPQARPRLFVVAVAARLRGPALLAQDALDAERRYARIHAARGGSPDAYDEGGGPRAVPLLEHGEWSEIPDRERGGAHGRIPFRLDRYHALGNAVAPQVAQVVGRRLLALCGPSARLGGGA